MLFGLELKLLCFCPPPPLAPPCWSLTWSSFGCPQRFLVRAACACGVTPLFGLSVHLCITVWCGCRFKGRSRSRGRQGVGCEPPCGPEFVFWMLARCWGQRGDPSIRYTGSGRMRARLCHNKEKGVWRSDANRPHEPWALGGRMRTGPTSPCVHKCVERRFREGRMRTHAPSGL